MATITEVQVIAWKSGRNFGAWHLARDDRPLCGAVIPDAAPVCTLSAARTPLAPADLCQSCLTKYASEDVQS